MKMCARFRITDGKRKFSDFSLVDDDHEPGEREGEYHIVSTGKVRDRHGREITSWGPDPLHPAQYEGGS